MTVLAENVKSITIGGGTYRLYGAVRTGMTIPPYSINAFTLTATDLCIHAGSTPPRAALLLLQLLLGLVLPNTHRKPDPTTGSTHRAKLLFRLLLLGHTTIAAAAGTLPWLHTSAGTILMYHGKVLLRKRRRHGPMVRYRPVYTTCRIPRLRAVEMGVLGERLLRERLVRWVHYGVEVGYLRRVGRRVLARRLLQIVGRVQFAVTRRVTGFTTNRTPTIKSRRSLADDGRVPDMTAATTHGHGAHR